MIPKQETYEFTHISDLGVWSNIGKLKIKVGANGKSDIYENVIYRILSCNDILDIHFLSTSLWWGHSSIGVKNVETAFRLLEDKVKSLGRIHIIVNTDFGKLINRYQEEVINMADDFWRASNCYVKFYCRLRPEDYKLYVKTNREEYYRIHFLNKERENGVLAFSGEIEVKKMSPFHYNNEIHSFMTKWNSSISLKSKINHIKKFGGIILDSFLYKRTLVESSDIFFNHCLRTKHRNVRTAYERMIEAASTDSSANLIIHITAFLEIFCKKVLGKKNSKKGYFSLIGILKARNIITSKEKDFLHRMYLLRNSIMHKAIEVLDKEDQVNDYLSLALKIANHPKNC